MAIRIAIIAEAHADFRVVSRLLDRAVLGSDLMPDYLKADLEQYETERQFSGVKQTDEYTKRSTVKGRFGQGPGLVSRFGIGLGDDLRDTERCVQLTILQGDEIDILIISRDSDGKEERLSSWQEVKEEYLDTSFKIILAGQHCKLEAWILNGFEPMNDSEVKALANIRSELGFPPVSQAEKLTAVSAGSKKNAKRVLHLLTESDYAREEKCWSETPLETLKKNGVKTGLSDYLDDVENDCVFLFQ